MSAIAAGLLAHLKSGDHLIVADDLFIISQILFAEDFPSRGIEVTPVPITDFTADQIRASISGKTFQYTRADGNGFVTYNADGTFSFQDDAKGGGVGKWTANGTQFCETWGKNPPECGVFKNTGDAYFAAKSRLVEMKT